MLRSRGRTARQCLQRTVWEEGLGQVGQLLIGEAAARRIGAKEAPERDSIH